MKKILVLLILMIICCEACSSGSDEIAFQIREHVISEDDGTAEEEQSSFVVVYVCGEVASPGVYELKEGSRIYEAIEAAGGLLDTADASRMNQAQVLKDGQQITVYSICDADGSETASSDTGRININYATLEELTSLPGIGESRAADIIAYREENGNFSVPEDLQNVSGIKEKTYKRIEDLIEV